MFIGGQIIITDHVRFHPSTHVYPYIMTYNTLATLPARAASTATLIIFASLISRAFLSPLNIRTEVSHLHIHYLISHTHIIVGILMYPF